LGFVCHLSFDIDLTLGFLHLDFAEWASAFGFDLPFELDLSFALWQLNFAWGFRFHLSFELWHLDFGEWALVGFT
jgi:hypothetical protein